MSGDGRIRTACAQALIMGRAPAGSPTMTVGAGEKAWWWKTVEKNGRTEGKSGGWRSKSPADGILKISPWYGVHSSPVGVWMATYWWGLLLASGQRFSQGSGIAGATVGNWRSGERVRIASYSKTLRSAAS